jgi:sucrose-6F-phosphate phosphohydrolase
MWIFASDIDGTLTGDRDALDRLAERLRKLRATGQLCLVFSTGRRLEQVLSGVAEEGLPEPDAVLCQVGTEVYLPPLAHDSEPLAAWRELLLAKYDRDEAESFLAGIAGLEMQPANCNTELKTSCFLDGCDDPEAAVAEIRRRVAPHADRYRVVWSSSRELDVLPAAAGKGPAIRFLVEHLQLDAERVVVAGDTGNDATMFEAFPRGIIVANAQPELVEWADSQPRDGIYRAGEPHAGGVEEGLVHFGVL